MSEQEPGVNTVRSLVDGYAAQCLDDLLKAGCAPQPDACLQARDGWSILLSVFPTPKVGNLPGLSECERHCLAHLGQCPKPISAANVRKELEHREIAIYGVVTVKRALARLHKAGIVNNSRKSPRGYFLPDALPLFLRRPGR